MNCYYKFYLQRQNANEALKLNHMDVEASVGNRVIFYHNIKYLLT